MKSDIRRIVIKLDVANCSPRMLRQRFRKEIRETIMTAHADGLIDLPIAEELIRAIPAEEVP